MAAGEKKWEETQKAKGKTKGVTKVQAERFGFKPGQVVSGTERARINRATKMRGRVERGGGTYRSPFDDSELEQNAYNAAKDEIDKTSSGSGAGSGGGINALDSYVRSIQKMLNTGDYRQPQDDLMSKLTEMYGGAQTQVGSAMDNLTSFLQGQQNPYQGFQAQAAQVTPQLTEFLQSQGAGTDPLAQLAAVRQQEATNQATAFQNLGNTLSQIYGANQQGMVADVGQQRANMLAALEGARAGYGTQIEQSAFENRNNLLQLLLQGLAKGGRPGKGSLTGGGSSGPSFLPKGVA